MPNWQFDEKIKFVLVSQASDKCHLQFTVIEFHKWKTSLSDL